MSSRSGVKEKAANGLQTFSIHKRRHEVSMQESQVVPSGSAAARTRNRLITGRNLLFADNLRRVQCAADHPDVVPS